MTPEDLKLVSEVLNKEKISILKSDGIFMAGEPADQQVKIYRHLFDCCYVFVRMPLGAEICDVDVGRVLDFCCRFPLVGIDGFPSRSGKADSKTADPGEELCHRADGVLWLLIRGIFIGHSFTS